MNNAYIFDFVMNINNLKREIYCEICRCKLANPIILPCGSFICERHIQIDKIKQLNKKFKCELCNKTHIIPEEGFPTNKLVSKAVWLIDSLEMGDTFRDSIKACENIENLHRKFDNLKADPSFFIHEYFNAIKNQMDLHKETIVGEIDRIHRELIDEIESREKECKAENEKSLLLFPAELIKESKEKLKRWHLNQLTPNFKNQVKWKEIQFLAIKEQRRLEAKLVEQHDFLLLNNNYQFVPQKWFTKQDFGTLNIQEKQVILLQFN